MTVFEEIITLLEHYSLRKTAVMLKEEIRVKDNIYTEKSKENYIKNLIKQHIAEIKNKDQKESYIAQTNQSFSLDFENVPGNANLTENNAMSKIEKVKVDFFVEKIVKRGFEEKILNEKQMKKVNRLSNLPMFKRLSKKAKEEISQEVDKKMSNNTVERDSQSSKMREDSPFLKNWNRGDDQMDHESSFKEKEKLSYERNENLLVPNENDNVFESSFNRNNSSRMNEEDDQIPAFGEPMPYNNDGSFAQDNNNQNNENNLQAFGGMDDDDFGFKPQPMSNYKQDDNFACFGIQDSDPFANEAKFGNQSSVEKQVNFGSASNQGLESSFGEEMERNYNDFGFSGSNENNFDSDFGNKNVAAFGNQKPKTADLNSFGCTQIPVSEALFSTKAKKISQEPGYQNSIIKTQEKELSVVNSAERNRKQLVERTTGLSSTELENLFKASFDNPMNLNNANYKKVLSSKLPHFVHHTSDDPKAKENFPILHDGKIIDFFKQKIIYDRESTNLEQAHEVDIGVGFVIGGRYKVLEMIGKTSFSRVFSCVDLQDSNQHKMCLKVIENQKVLFDQSIQEIKMLKLIHNNCNVDEFNIMKIFDYFYWREHLVLVTELLGENLYEYDRKRRASNNSQVFNLQKQKSISHQLLKSLAKLHEMNIIHCDVKPENILISDEGNNKIKLIDFGSCCFQHENPTFYMQTRPYRAPELILGCEYDTKIDIWSLGCVLLELYTGITVFECPTIQSILAKIIAVCGPVPDWMIKTGKFTRKYFTKDFVLFHEIEMEAVTPYATKSPVKRSRIELQLPEVIDLYEVLNEDEVFINFLKGLLDLDPYKRLSAKEALNHAWFK